MQMVRCSACVYARARMPLPLQTVSFATAENYSAGPPALPAQEAVTKPVPGQCPGWRWKKPSARSWGRG